MKMVVALVLVVFSINAFGQSTAPAKEVMPHWRSVAFDKYHIHYVDSDASKLDSLEGNIKRGVSIVETFFGQKFPRPFNIYIFPNRESLNRQWSTAWKLPGFKSACWMVASGVGDRLDLLSPAVWKKQACEHDPADKVTMQRLITHELVHVFQGQSNPHPDLGGMDDIGWFVEGLAVYVSGQLTSDRINRAVKSIKQDKYPAALKNAWSGPDRYGFSGLMVSYIASNYGHGKLIDLLPMTDQKEILSSLHTTESDFLGEWRTWVIKRYGSTSPG